MLFILLLIAAIAGGGYYVATNSKDRASEHEKTGKAEAHQGGESSDLPRVEIVKPVRGGMEMTTVQPGTVHAFEYAQLYAKVSGYVETLTVDRGSRVKKGELLLSLYVPELVAAVKQAKASLIRAHAAVDRPRPT